MFDPFGDFAVAGYLRNVAAEQDLEIVKAVEHELFRAQIPAALDVLARRRRIEYADFLGGCSRPRTYRVSVASAHRWTLQPNAPIPVWPSDTRPTRNVAGIGSTNSTSKAPPRAPPERISQGPPARGGDGAIGRRQKGPTPKRLARLVDMVTRLEAAAIRPHAATSKTARCVPPARARQSHQVRTRNCRRCLPLVRWARLCVAKAAQNSCRLVAVLEADGHPVNPNHLLFHAPVLTELQSDPRFSAPGSGLERC